MGRKEKRKEGGREEVRRKGKRKEEEGRGGERRERSKKGRGKGREERIPRETTKRADNSTNNLANILSLIP